MPSVVTNGCFDGLHLGHIRTLQRCRELADGGSVTVFLNSDESVRQLKGEGRPIHPFAERREMLQALRFVGSVVPFDTEEGLAELYRHMRPDILVKGPPWKEGQLTGQEWVGQVVILESLAEASTSAVYGRPSIEVLNPRHPRGPFGSAVFDFDGTLSTLRDGWQEIMAMMMVKELGPGSGSEVHEMIAETTGTQTIHQMMWLAGKKADGTSPGVYKARFLDLLEREVKTRMVRKPPRGYLLPGSHEVLARLNAAGVHCYLASGTDTEAVVREATWLGINGYFRGIYGAEGSSTACPKKRVFQSLAERQSAIVAFGDGKVEIREAAAVGALAVGIVRDGNRQRLVDAGAHILIEDFARDLVFLGD